MVRACSPRLSRGLPGGAVAGSASSAFVIFPNPGKLALDPATFDPLELGFKGLEGARAPELNNRLRLALLC
jgi:hypothetical protein